MTYLVGYSPEERGKAVLHLAAMLSRSSGQPLVVCSVVPKPWYPSMAKVDAEYHVALDHDADAALAYARANLPADVEATFVRHRARSGPAGLLEVADQHDAELIVLGSSSAGVFGHVALGSVTSRLLHSSPLAIALATRGFRAPPGVAVRRITAAYGGSQGAEAVVVASAALAARAGASLRIATFAVWQRPAYTTRLGADGEDTVLAEWVSDMREATQEALTSVRELPHVPRDLDGVVGIGTTWDEAMEELDWDTGEVLVVGSSGLGPLAHVFLGSRATKIVRHSPVPVVVLPGAVAEELAGQTRST
jgi:nucleotide-binding universal stress UspA family protein